MKPPEHREKHHKGLQHQHSSPCDSSPCGGRRPYSGHQHDLQHRWLEDISHWHKRYLAYQKTFPNIRLDSKNLKTMIMQNTLKLYPLQNWQWNGSRLLPATASPTKRWACHAHLHCTLKQIDLETSQSHPEARLAGCFGTVFGAPAAAPRLSPRALEPIFRIRHMLFTCEDRLCGHTIIVMS